MNVLTDQIAHAHCWRCVMILSEVIGSLGHGIILLCHVLLYTNHLLSLG